MARDHGFYAVLMAEELKTLIFSWRPMSGGELETIIFALVPMPDQFEILICTLVPTASSTPGGLLEAILSYLKPLLEPSWRLRGCPESPKQN